MKNFLKIFTFSCLTSISIVQVPSVLSNQSAVGQRSVSGFNLKFIIHFFSLQIAHSGVLMRQSSRAFSDGDNEGEELRAEKCTLNSITLSHFLNALALLSSLFKCYGQ